MITKGQILTQSDTCDRCGVQALILVRKATPDEAERSPQLTLCGHHYTRHELELLLDGWTVEVDDRRIVFAARTSCPTL